MDQILRLLCRQDDVLVVRQDKNGVSVYLCHGIHHILRGRIHRLSAFNQAVHSEIPENAPKSLSDGNGNKTDILMGRR